MVLTSAGDQPGVYPPLAVVANQWKNYTGDGVVDSFSSYGGLVGGFDPLPFPLLMRNNANWNTGLVVQNASGSSNGVTLRYYHQSTAHGGAQCATTTNNLGGNEVWIVYPAPPAGPCTTGGIIFAGVADGTQPAVGIVNERHTATGNYKIVSYRNPQGHTPRVIVPYVLKSMWWRGRSDWRTGLAVQNMGAGPANVVIRYYDAGGNYMTNLDDTATVPPGSVGIFTPVPLGQATFRGSAEVGADQPIAVGINLIASGGSADAAMSFHGVNR